jgi:hypothetical protein
MQHICSVDGSVLDLDIKYMNIMASQVLRNVSKNRVGKYVAYV